MTEALTGRRREQGAMVQDLDEAQDREKEGVYV